MLDITNTQQANVTLEILDKKGKPAAVTGVPLWVSSDPTIATVTVAADGLSADVVGVSEGTSQITVTADTSQASGVQPITSVLDVTVHGSPPAVMNIIVGPILDQP